MHEDASDPLADLLAPQAACSSKREEIFSKTLGPLRCQRRLRRLSGIGVLIAAYGAGLLTMLVCQHPVVETPVSWTADEKTEPLPSTPVPSGPALEWQAVDNPESAPKLSRQAADLYLGQADPAEAVRCYGNSLDAEKNESLNVSAEDSWLLMAIKNARKKERNECGK